MDNEDKVAEAIDRLATSFAKVAKAITPEDASSWRDETDNHVESLTEAVMGVTAGLCWIASAINDLSDAVREAGESFGESQ